MITGNNTAPSERAATGAAPARYTSRYMVHLPNYSSVHWCDNS